MGVTKKGQDKGRASGSCCCGKTQNIRQLVNAISLVAGALNLACLASVVW